MALLLACCLLLAFPGSSSAHAVLVRSDPAQDAVLRVPPGQVRLWFSEAVDPELSTAQVVTPTNQQVGPQQVRVPPAASSEIVVTLSSRLEPGVYVVIWRTISTDDGHVESGSFSFTVTQPNGTLPPRPHPPAGATAPSAPPTASLLDAPLLVSLFMTTLVELGAIGWVGAMIFQLFVLEPVLQEHPTQRNLHQQVRASLLDRVQPLAVGGLLLAHVGVLIGQALALTQGNSATAFTPAILQKLVLNEHFGPRGGARPGEGDRGSALRLGPSDCSDALGRWHAEYCAELRASACAQFPGGAFLLTGNALAVLLTVGADRSALDGSHRPAQCLFPTHLLGTIALHCLWECPARQSAPGDDHARAQCLPDPDSASSCACGLAEVWLCRHTPGDCTVSD